MGRVIKITNKGFLGFGKKQKYEYFCDKCGKQVAHDHFIDDEGLYYCRTCGNSINPLIVHYWNRFDLVERFRIDEFFLDTSDGQEKYIDNCGDCRSLVIHTKTPNGLSQIYYQIGKQEPVLDVFKCIKHGTYNEDGNLEEQVNCTHSWLDIATTKKVDEEAHREYKGMMGRRNRAIESMFGTDEVEIQHWCYGETHYWCFKCGLYRKYSPQREHLLPIKGLKK